jgi:mono/diheme cytochrome c family protein
MVCALLFLATGGLLCSAIAAVVPAKTAPPASDPPAPRRPEAAKLYAAKCSNCHGGDGRGKDLRATVETMPDFTSAAWQQKRKDKDISACIADGRDPLMPAFRDKLAKEEIEALTAHVRSLAAAPLKKAPMALARFTRPAAGPIAAPPAEQLYKDGGCVNCHDKDGRGTAVRKAMPEIPDFTDGKWHKDHADDADLAKSILEGKGKFMTAQKDKLSKDDVTKLIAYVRKFKDAKPAANKAPEPPAAALYQERCAGCHGKDGRGGEAAAALPNLPDFANPTWQASRSDAQLAVSLLDGKGTFMPSFRDKLKGDQAKALVARVRSFAPNGPQAKNGMKTSDFEEKLRRLEEEFQELKRQQDELLKKSPR